MALLTEAKPRKFCAEPILDTVGISFPIESDFVTEGATVNVVGWGTDTQSATFRHQLKGGGFVGLGKAGAAFVEASLPKRLGDDNVVGLTLVEGVEVVRELFVEAQAFCTPREVGSFAECNVTRADLVRDFDDVHHLAELLDGLAPIRRGGRAKVRRWMDTEANKAETLVHGVSRAWRNTLYDKHAESLGRAPVGRVRFEARLRRQAMRSEWAKGLGGHVRQVADLTEGKLIAMRRGMFERSCYDREVSAMATVADAVMTCEGLSSRERGQFWAYLTMPGFALRVSRNTELKYRRLAAHLGVVPERAMADVEASVTVRLDFDRGTEVVRAA